MPLFKVLCFCRSFRWQFTARYKAFPISLTDSGFIVIKCVSAHNPLTQILTNNIHTHTQPPESGIGSMAGCNEYTSIKKYLFLLTDFYIKYLTFLLVSHILIFLVAYCNSRTRPPWSVCPSVRHTFLNTTIFLQSEMFPVWISCDIWYLWISSYEIFSVMKYFPF